MAKTAQNSYRVAIALGNAVASELEVGASIGRENFTGSDLRILGGVFDELEHAAARIRLAVAKAERAGVTPDDLSPEDAQEGYQATMDGLKLLPAPLVPGVIAQGLQAAGVGHSAPEWLN